MDTDNNEYKADKACSKQPGIFVRRQPKEQSTCPHKFLFRACGIFVVCALSLTGSVSSLFCGNF